MTGSSAFENLQHIRQRFKKCKNKNNNSKSKYLPFNTFLKLNLSLVQKNKLNLEIDILFLANK